MNFSIGLSALQANQTAMSVAGHNIANASTEGYRRQTVLFAENPSIDIGGHQIGTGVSIAEIRSAGDAALEESLMRLASDGAMLSTRLDAAKRLESLFLPGTGTIQERTDELFVNLERLSALPHDASLRAAVVRSAADLSDSIRETTTALDELASDTGRQITETVTLISEHAAGISALNKQIAELESIGKQAFGLRNQRDQVVKELAALIDVQRRVLPDGGETFVMGGGMFSIDATPLGLTVLKNDEGQLEIWKKGCDKPIAIQGGKLAGLLDQHNNSGGINGMQDHINDFTSALVQHLDAAHATGVGIGGAFDSLTSTRRVDDGTSSLASQDTIVPLQAGSLFVSVNDLASAQSTLTRIDIDPTSQSLEDVANLLGVVDNLRADVDSLGRISIVAAPGYSFDFTGNLQTQPDESLITGTTEPTISGRYTGAANEQYSFRFVGDGTVGVTEGLQLEVLDGNMATVRVLDVGKNYEPSSALVVAHGVEVSLASGTAAAGDSFHVQLAGQPDETNLLAALGLNTMFTGTNSRSFTVNPMLTENPSTLATTTNGEPSDTRNLLRMIDVRDDRILRDGTVTIEQFLFELSTGVGQEVTELTRDVAGNDERRVFLQSELDSVVGVDVNEEIARMLQLQRSYQAAARYISVVDSMLQELFNII